MTDKLKYGERRKLPARRRGYNQKLVIVSGGKRIGLYLRTGEYPDGTLGEIFIDIAQRNDATLRAMANMLAISVSIALQHGTPLETLVELYTFTKFEPSGPVQCSDRVKMCSSITDLVFRELAIRYLGRDDLAHVPKPEAAGKP